MSPPETQLQNGFKILSKLPLEIIFNHILPKFNKLTFKDFIQFAYFQENFPNFPKTSINFTDIFNPNSRIGKIFRKSFYQLSPLAVLEQFGSIGIDKSEENQKFEKYLHLVNRMIMDEMFYGCLDDANYVSHPYYYMVDYDQYWPRVEARDREEDRGNTRKRSKGSTFLSKKGRQLMKYLSKKGRLQEDDSEANNDSEDVRIPLQKEIKISYAQESGHMPAIYNTMANFLRETIKILNEENFLM